MKTILQLKKIFTIPLLFLVGNIWGQITYSSSNLVTGSGLNCSIPNATCNSAWSGSAGNIRISNISINSGNIIVTVSKCSGTFGYSGTGYVKETNECSTNPVVQNTYNSGVSSFDINFNVTHTGSKTYYITLTSNASGSPKYTAGKFTVTGTCNTSSNVNPASISFSNITTNQATASWSNVSGAIGYEINYTLCSASNYSGAMFTTTSGTSVDLTGLTAGTQYKMQIRTVFPNGCNSLWSSSSNCFTTATPCGQVNGSNSTASNISTSSFTANWQAVTGANYYNINVKKCTDADYSNALSFQTSTATTSLALSTLDCGECYRFQIQAVCSSGAGSWSTSNPSDIQLTQPAIPNASSVTFSNITQTSFTANWATISGAIGYRVNYTTCTGTFALQDLPTTTNSITINSLTSNTQYKIQIRAVYPNQCFSAWSPSSPCVTTLSNSCITWSGTPPTGEKLTAANYLCTNGIIVNTQNGTDNATNGIQRELLAKITYLGIYKGSTPNSPAVNFPVPFTDMQGSTSPYLDAIKTLAYLQFTDDITPFDRDLINFNPNTLIPRKYVVKAMAEAFNITKSIATPSPFSDVNTTDEMYGYIKRFHELGFVTGNTQYTAECTTGTCFHPDADITREDVFVILYRILIATNITRPIATQLNSITNYFVPGNNRTATMGKVPGLDQANFNHYQKTSFSIAGRGIPLDFTHVYNSFLTELPKGYFEDGTSGQSFSPLGIGWTHTYNIYAVRVAGYTFDSVTEPDKIMFYYPDGSINVYNYATNMPDEHSIGVYDEMTKTAILGGERITITTKGQIKYVFENANNGKFYFIKTIKDRNNNGVKINWDNYINNPSRSLFRISSVQEEFNNGSLGRSFMFNYASSILPYLDSVTDSSINRTINFNVNLPTRSLTSYTDAKGNPTQYKYDDPTNYNKSNLLTEIWLPKGNKIKNTYVQRKLKNSQLLNNSGVATSTITVDWTQNYAAGQQYNSSAVITDPQGKITNFTHNSLGNPSLIVSPTDNTTINSYDMGNNAHLPTSITNNGQTTTISYNNKGDILNISKNSISNSYTYTTPFNDVWTFTDGNNNTTTYHYSPTGNLETISRPSGYGYTSITRNAFEQVETITNQSGIMTAFGYDTNGMQNKITIPGNIHSYKTFDNASRLIAQKDQNEYYTTFQYDFNDNVEDIWDDYGNNTNMTYDSNDNNDTIRNAKLELQTKTYKFETDKLETDSFGSHTKSYTYNTDGTLATHTRGNGTFNYTYDSTTGRLTSDGQTSYTYHEPSGNIATITNANGTLSLYYDNHDRLEYYDDYYGNRVSYTYDNNNNVKTISYPSNPANTKVIEYFYDAVNRCYKVKDWNGKETFFEYELDDRLKKITLPNTTFADYTYNNAGRLEGIANKKADQTIITNYTFSLDNAGNHLTETIIEPSITAGLQTIANETTTYGLYPFNRIQSQGSTTFTHNTAGGIEQAGSNNFTYDVNDNMLTAPNSSFSYDGEGNRRAKTVNGIDTRYVLSILGMSQVLMETNSSNAVQNYYVYGPTGLLYRIKADNTTYSYYHYDYRGSTTAITNEAQNITHSYSYDPFGKILAKTEADTNPFQYVGQHGVQYESPTLTFIRARYYDPTTGRFVSEDPVWALNLYPYADNNPLMRIDPTGLDYRIDGVRRIYGKFNDSIKIAYWNDKNEYKIDYIFAPKNTNVKGNIDYFKEVNKGLLPHEIHYQFYLFVKSGGAFDYKKYDSKYEAFGNFNFGAIGKHAYGDITLLTGAGLYQIKSGTSSISYYNSYFDDPKDTHNIKLGIAYYRFLNK